VCGRADDGGATANARGDAGGADAARIGGVVLGDGRNARRRVSSVVMVMMMMMMMMLLLLLMMMMMMLLMMMKLSRVVLDPLTCRGMTRPRDRLASRRAASPRVVLTLERSRT